MARSGYEEWVFTCASLLLFSCLIRTSSMRKASFSRSALRRRRFSRNSIFSF